MSGAVLVWLVTWTSRAATLTVISTIVLRLARRTNASTRYMAWWITLVGVLALAVIPWSWPIVPESAFGSEGASPATLLGASPERLLDPMRNVAIRPIWSVLAMGTLALGGGGVLLGQTPPIMTVGPAAVLPMVPRLDVNAPNLRPLLASSRGLASTGETSGVGARISTAQSGKLSPPPRIVNQTTLLAHAELSALRGLTPPDSLRPALVGRHFTPVLRSRVMAVDAEFAFPMNVPFPKPTELGSRYKAMDTGPGPWGRIVSAGQAVGVGASYAGVATAAAFQTVGSSIVRVFVGSR